MLALGLGFGAANTAQGTEFTAGVVLDNMKMSDRYTFVAGIVEGLAHARYATDGRETAGRSCIYRWFYEEEKSFENVLAAFARFPDQLPGAVIGALITRRCG